MTSAASASGPDARRLGASSFKSVPDMWLHRCHSTPNAEAMRFRQDGAWQSMTWREAEARARDIANGLLSLGVEPEQRCCILARTRPEWVLVDMAILCAGAATTTVFPSSPAEECSHILSDCEAVVLFCDADQLDTVAAIRADLPALHHVVVLDEDAAADDTMALSALERAGRDWAAEHPDAYDAAHADIEPERLATLMYTSGTTGEPKGVMLTHDAWVYEAAAVDALGLVSPADLQYLFLPLSHVFAKVLEVVFIRLGVPTVIDSDSDRLLDNLAETRPTWMGAVPRVFEKAWARIVTEAREGGALHTRLFDWALGVGREVSRVRQSGREPGGLIALQYRLAQRLVYRHVNELFGGRIRFFVSGAAPLSAALAEFFHACDLPILEGYGLTESCAASCLNGPDDFVFGSVGRPLPGTSIRLDEDGEVLISGRGVMRGYYHRDDDTEAALWTDEQGTTWLRTGDIGRLLDSGHLVITGRKKDLIVTSGGKNVAPAGFQNRLKARSPWVAQVLLHGDNRPYCVALVAIDADTVGRWATEQELSWSDYAELAALPEVRELIEADIDSVNAELAPHARARKFALLPAEPTVEDGALTPSLKIKRRVLEERYAHLLDAFYEGSAEG